MSFHCLLISVVTDQKLLVNCIKNPFHVMNCFSLAAFRILCFDSLTVSLGLDLFEFILLRVHLASYMKIYFEYFPLFLQIFFLTLLNSQTPTMHALTCLMVSHRSLRMN